MKPACERCSAQLGPESVAYICSFECTFCSSCARSLERKCPNCGGELNRRPRRLEVGAASSEVGELQRARVGSAMAYIDSHATEPLRLSQIAAAVHLSTHHLTRLFKAATGHPPHRYLVQRRMEHAKGLLLESSLSIAQIAQEVGFASASHFSETFRRRMGVTPGDFRLRRSRA